jgi:hypothetical protein
VLTDLLQRLRCTLVVITQGVGARLSWAGRKIYTPTWNRNKLKARERKIAICEVLIFKSFGKYYKNFLNVQVGIALLNSSYIQIKLELGIYNCRRIFKKK